MRVGKLDKKGQITKPIKTQDAAGGATTSWQLHADVWFSLKPLNGKEKYVSHEKYATATHEVMMRYVAGVKPEMRLEWNGRVFEIKAALNVLEKGTNLQLIVEEDI